MYAVIETGGKQYRVRPGDRIAVERLEAAEGAEVSLGDVLLVGDDSQTKVGTPTVAGASVRARVEAHDRAPKVTQSGWAGAGGTGSVRIPGGPNVQNGGQ